MCAFPFFFALDDMFLLSQTYILKMSAQHIIFKLPISNLANLSVLQIHYDSDAASKKTLEIECELEKEKNPLHPSECQHFSSVICFYRIFWSSSCERKFHRGNGHTYLLST